MKEIHLGRDDLCVEASSEAAAQALEEMGFVRCQEESGWKCVAKGLIKDFIKIFLAILASTLIASWVDPSVDGTTLTLCAACAITAYEFFR